MLILPILTTSLLHLSIKEVENVLFKLGSERINIDTKRLPRRLNTRPLCHFLFFQEWMG